MKILQVIASLNPEAGGTVEGVLQLSNMLERAGHAVEIACLDPPEAPWASGTTVPVHCLGPGRFGKYGYCKFFVPWLKLNASRFDAVIVNGIWQYHSLATWRALRGTGTPYFVFTHGMLDPWFRRTYPLKHAKKWLYWPWADYRVLRNAKAVLFTCEEEKVLARQSFCLYRATEAIVSLGIPPPVGDPLIQQEVFLEKYPQLRDHRCLLFLSRLHPKKGCDLLLRAFAAVAQRDPDLRLIMAGPDQIGWRKELEALAGELDVADRIVWTGMLTGDMKWGAFRASQAFVLPSHSENFGIVVAEAMACGKPVLVSNRVNIWREIEESQSGLVAADELQPTTAMLEQWCSMQPSQRELLGSNAERAFHENFEIGIAVNRLVSTIRGHAADHVSSDGAVELNL